MKPAAIIAALVFTAPALATPPAMIPGWVNKGQPTTHVHDEHKPQLAKRDAMLADATARAQQLQAAHQPSTYRDWQILGGTSKSAARIIDYKGGLITLQKRDGTTRTVREQRLGKSDRAFFETWTQQPAPRRANSFPSITSRPLVP